MSRFALRPVAAALFLTSTAASAADDNPIIVTATRTAQIADAALAPVIVINRAEIERSQAQDVADLLRTHAGLDIARNGGPGQATSLFIRGTESNHVLVMVDGVKINPGTIGGAALQNIDPALIERVEIVKGPRSTLYGSDAVGGVINIITRRAQTTRLGAYIGAGRYDTRRAGATAQGAKDELRGGIDLGYTNSAGFPARTTSNVDNGYDNLSVNAYAGKQWGPVNVELSHWQAQGNSEYLDFFLSPLDQDYTNRVTALRLDATPNDYWTTTLRLSQAVDNIEQNQSSDFAYTRRNALDWQHNFQIDPTQLLTAGLWLSRDDTHSAVFGSGFNETTDVQALYVQEDMSIGDHRVLLAARYTHHDAFGSHTTWDAEYGYKFGQNTRVSAAVGTAFRAPDATDRFGFGGDPNLDPETARNLEVGLHHALDAHQRVSVSVFDNRIRDLIEYDLGASQMMNIGRARIRGVEASYNYETTSWGTRIEAIAQDPEDENSGEQLARRAKRTVSASVHYDIARYRLSADWLATSKRKDSAFSSTYNAGYRLVNLTARAQVQKDWTVQARVENLFDQNYTLADGYNTMGRALYAEVRYGTGN